MKKSGGSDEPPSKPPHPRKPGKRIEVSDNGTVRTVDVAKRRAIAKAAWIKRGSPRPGVKGPAKPVLTPEQERIKRDAEQIAANSSPEAIAAAADRRIAVRAWKKRNNASLRAYRKGIMDTLVETAKRVPPTPLTRLRHRKCSFARMCDRKEITGEMMQAAQEIDLVYMAISGALFGKSMPIEPRSPGNRGTMSDKVADAHINRFKPWADELSRRKKHGGPPCLEIVIDVVVDSRSLSDIDAERGWRNGFANYIVRRSLLEYAVKAKWAPPEALDRFDRLMGLSVREKGYA